MHKRNCRYTLNEKIERIAEWKTSGLSAEDYCSQHQINPNTFKNWPHHIKLANTKKKINEAFKFLPVNLSETSKIECICRLSLPYGIQLEMPNIKWYS